MARSQKPERFIVPIIVSVWIMALIEIGFIVASGVRLGALASAGVARASSASSACTPTTSGRLYAVAYALLLFTWGETKNPR